MATQARQLSPLDGQPLMPRLTVVHNARTGGLLLMSASCIAGASSKHVETFLVLAVLTLGLVFFAMATRKTDWGAQPVWAAELGLQLGTLFRDVRGSELHSCTPVTNGFELHARFVTLQLQVESAQVAALGETLNRGLGPLGLPRSNLSFRTGLALGVLAAGGATLALWKFGVDQPRERLRQITLVALAGRPIIDAVSWLYFKRAGRRL